MKEDLGTLGENTAVSYLLEQGAQILHRNWKCSAGEIDIIAMVDEYLVFVEVKSRSSTIFGRPEDFVDDKKKKRMSAAISYYMEEHEHDWEIRFDIVSVIFDSSKQYRLQHFADAFFPGL